MRHYIDFMINTKKPVDLGIFIWLLILTIMIFLIILIGGLTRLTESGLSMVDWQPILGTIPPLNKENWLNAFEKYQNSPEFIIVNKTMNLNEFKYIFLWEWFHRFFARCIGLALVLPMIFFLIKQRMNKNLIISLMILFIFGFFQAFIGWWMVKSGLTENPYVSPYRLAFHLSNAVIIFSILFWLTLNFWYVSNINFFPKSNIEISVFILYFLLIITIISGAFMAGTNSGQSFNTYPLMNGNLIPDDYFLISNSIRNLFENTVAINFNHRWLSTFTFLSIISFAIYVIISKEVTNQNFSIFLITFFAFLQFFLGIFTLLSNVKIWYASMHQINSVLLLTAILYTYYSIEKERLF